MLLWASCSSAVASSRPTATQTDASDVTQVTYTNEPRTYGNLISQRKSGASHYYLFDALGSTRLVTDASESVAESLLYDAWGNLVGSAPTLAVPFRWVGELGYLFVPVTSDYYVRARVYQPGIGRWISQDPFLVPLLVTQAYCYVANAVVEHFDPTGLHESIDDPSSQHTPGAGTDDDVIRNLYWQLFHRLLNVDQLLLRVQQMIEFPNPCECALATYSIMDATYISISSDVEAVPNMNRKVELRQWCSRANKWVLAFLGPAIERLFPPAKEQRDFKVPN